MSSPDSSDCDSDVTELETGVVDMIEELTEVIDEQVTEEPNVEGNEEEDNGPSRIPNLLKNMLNLTQYNEGDTGRNYNILKEKYDDQLMIIKAYGRQIEEKVKMIRSLKNRTTRERRKLEKRTKELEDRINGISEPPVPWSHKLREFLQGETGDYGTIFRDSCKQENMSQKMTVLHPSLGLRHEVVSEQTLLLRRERARNKYDTSPGDFLSHRRFMALILPSIFITVQPIYHRLLGQPTFPFERLPAEIQVKIFARVFVKSPLVHCLSRLDPLNPPLQEDFPKKDTKGESQLPTGFHFSTRPCQIALMRRPHDVLDPLLVCKRWYYVGVHAFYGANTFAFSSLGEWHRFCNGIGMARVERLVNVELMWHGSNMRRHKTRISRRSVGLSWFTKTRRLRTLVVHIQESAKDRRRRKYENPDKVWNSEDDDDDDDDYEEEEEEQLFVSENGSNGNYGNGRKGNRSKVNNNRDNHSDDEDTCRPSDVPFNPVAALMKENKNRQKLRSMRTVQGMDYIYQLRGMKWIRFKERDGVQKRQSILDPSFLEDIGRAVTQPKRRSAEIKSELKYLLPLKGLEDWIPSEKDMRIVEAFYDESPNVDWAYGYGNSDDEDLAEDDLESDYESVAGSLLDDEDDPVPPGSPETLMTPPATPPNRAEQYRQKRDDKASENASDDDDRSSGLFVSSRSNSTITPSERMEVDKEEPPGNGDGNALGKNLENNPHPDPGLSFGSAGPLDPITIDLTGDDDEESLFVPTSSPGRSVKIEPADGHSRGPSIDPTTPNQNNNDDDSDESTGWDYESESDRFYQEDTPPGDDELLIQEPIPPPRPPRKRPSKKNSESGGSSTKRRKLNSSTKSKG
ncbi:uncharacterized protein GGS22DRAFT_198081 [Annulohypoxylon maeteangense]|uniref:uncharacterized protein n=1 Tax=Annulohypoxylon maeteangense TaxID=1927788 RepID=UPI002007A129|nr:uncharacterized protein GGS22DRAFT_198081 [Annulohypoxylon maeteangense]KAI0888286.1 hypothetical protein GGS22DRAFT_198081 [Annulohypoxylon maeteangense]